MSDKFIYTARGIKKAYPLPGGEPFWAFNDIDVVITQGGLTILRGRNGSG